MDLVFSLTAKQEIEFDAWLQTQNQEIVEKQIQNSDQNLSEEQVEVLKKLLETGSPIPYHDGKYGYYSISFTPTDFGNRIYVHNHITNESFRLHDPSVESDEIPVSETEVIPDDAISGEFTVEDILNEQLG
jgi:hypothetical protein